MKGEVKCSTEYVPRCEVLMALSGHPVVFGVTYTFSMVQQFSMQKMEVILSPETLITTYQTTSRLEVFTE
jgi:hypothetical protein